MPALREACLAEDEQQLAEGNKSKGRRRGKAKAKNDDGERVDGRAGPRSENVVLSKSEHYHVKSTCLIMTLSLAIDYLHDLLSERDVLMQRLHTARSALPATHPLLRPNPDTPIPLWERKWSGGEEKNDDDDDDVDD